MKILKIVLYFSLIVFYQIANGTITLFCLFLVLANTHSKKAPTNTKDKSQMNEKIVQDFKQILYGTPLLVEVRSSTIKPISIIETKIQFILKYELGLVYLYQLVLDEGKSEYAAKLLDMVENKMLFTIVQKQELLRELGKFDNLEAKLDVIIRSLENNA